MHHREASMHHREASMHNREVYQQGGVPTGGVPTGGGTTYHGVYLPTRVYVHPTTLGIHHAHTVRPCTSAVLTVTAVTRRRGPGLNLLINREYEAHRGLQPPKGVTVRRRLCAELLSSSRE